MKYEDLRNSKLLVTIAHARCRAGADREHFVIGNFKFLLAFLALTVAATPAVATDDGDNNWQYSVLLNSSTFTHDREAEGTTKGDVGTLGFGLGKEFNDYLLVEGRLGVGFKEENVTNCQYIDRVENCDRRFMRVNWFLSTYARGYFMPPGSVRPYGLIGLTTARTDVTYEGFRYQADITTATSLSYGIGIAFGSGRKKLGVEYLSLFDSNNQAIDGFNVSLQIAL